MRPRNLHLGRTGPPFSGPKVGKPGIVSSVTRPIRVLATGFGTLPGSNAHASALTSLVQGLRAEVDLVTLRAPEQAHQGRVGDARLFRVRAVGTAVERRQVFARAVRRQLEAEHYDLVHVRGADEGALVLPLLASLGFRFVYEVATFPEPDEPREVWNEWRAKHDACLAAADLILTPSSAGAETLALEGHGEKTSVVWPGVDIVEFDHWSSAPSSTLRLLYLGNLESDRDTETVLNAVRELAQTRRLRVLLAGDPEDERRVRATERIIKLGLGEVVTVKPQPSEAQLSKFIAAADIALVPASPTERYEDHADVPEPLLAHLACRRPVVAAGLPAIGEIVRDEQDGLLYLPGDVPSLVEAIRQLADDPKLAEDLAYQGYLRVRETFSSARRARRLAAVYEKLVPGSQEVDAWDDAFGLSETRSGLAALETHQRQDDEELPAPPGFRAPSDVPAAAQEPYPLAPLGRPSLGDAALAVEVSDDFGGPVHTGGYEEADILFQRPEFEARGDDAPLADATTLEPTSPFDQAGPADHHSPFADAAPLDEIDTSGEPTATRFPAPGLYLGGAAGPPRADAPPPRDSFAEGARASTPSSFRTEGTGSDSGFLALQTPVFTRAELEGASELADDTTDIAALEAEKRPGPEPLDELDTDAR